MGFGTIFFIVVAAIVLFQLRNVLGRRTGSERPPFDPYSRPEETGAPVPGNVVTLPGRQPRVGTEVPAADPYEPLSKAAAPGTPLNAELRRIKDADPSFDVDAFLKGVRAAYEMVVAAFADGDRKLLKNLLSADVYSGFEAAITDRESRSERMKSDLVGINDATILAAELKDREALVTVRIVSQLVSVVTAPDNRVIDGDPETVVEVKDVWTFGRDTRSRDPNWKLVETESEDD